MRKVTVQLEVVAPDKMSDREVAKMVDRLIAIGEEDAEESADLFDEDSEDRNEDADTANDMVFKKAKVVK